jgi:hypothetical protein
VIIMLSYDLNGHERPNSYTAVKEMIEEHAIASIKALYSQWLIETSDAVAVWDARMKGVTDADDRWIIDLVTSSRAGWLNKSVWTWLKERS